MLCYQEVMLFKRKHLHSIEMIIEVYRYVTSPEAASPDCLVAWFCRVCISKFIVSQPNLKYTGAKLNLKTSHLSSKPHHVGPICPLFLKK